MSDIELYKKLAEKFDKDMIVGAPMSNSLLKILMLLFNPDEVKIALILPSLWDHGPLHGGTWPGTGGYQGRDPRHSQGSG